jgi:hypothetical protein
VPFLAGQRISAGALTRETTKVIARARRVTTSSASTGAAVAVLRLDGVPLLAGRAYRVRSSGIAFDTSVANDVGFATIFYETNGTSATTSDDRLPGAVIQSGLINAAQGETGVINADYFPATDMSASFLLAVGRAAGSGNITLFADGTTNVIELFVEDNGVDPGDTGTDL